MEDGTDKEGYDVSIWMKTMDNYKNYIIKDTIFS